jgi:hypothetical protein
LVIPAFSEYDWRMTFAGRQFDEALGYLSLNDRAVGK